MSKMRFSGRTLQLSTVVASCAVCLALMGASRGAITKLTLILDAPVVDLFDGMRQEQIEARLVAQSPYEGRIFITNKTDKPLTVAVPMGLAGVQILPQIGQNGANLFGNLPGALNNGANGQNGQNGQNGLAQAVGGNAAPAGNNAFPGAGPNGFPGNNGNGLNNNFPNAAGFFSIPPEKTVEIRLNSVCLNYGRREPHPGLKYKLVKAETVTTDPVLLQLLEDYSPRTNRDVQQAAVWQLSSGLTWEQVTQLMDEKVPGDPRPQFSAQQIQGARRLVEQVKRTAANRPKKADPVSSVVTK